MRQHCRDSSERVKLLLLKIALLLQSVSRATRRCAARQAAPGSAARGGGSAGGDVATGGRGRRGLARGLCPERCPSALGAREGQGEAELRASC